MAATPEGRIAKFQDFETEAEAAAHVAAFAQWQSDGQDGMVKAGFVVGNPGGNVGDWRVDAGALISDPHIKTLDEIQNEDIAKLNTMLGGLAKLQVRLIQYLMAQTAWKKPVPADFSAEDIALFNEAKALVNKIDGI